MITTTSAIVPLALVAIILVVVAGVDDGVVGTQYTQRNPFFPQKCYTFKPNSFFFGRKD